MHGLKSVFYFSLSPSHISGLALLLLCLLLILMCDYEYLCTMNEVRAWQVFNVRNLRKKDENNYSWGLIWRRRKPNDYYVCTMLSSVLSSTTLPLRLVFYLLFCKNTQNDSD